MNETLDRIIKQSGGMWAETTDRTQTPVLLVSDIARDAKVFELTLPPNESHPFWRINERSLTDAEYTELSNVWSAMGLSHVGTLIPIYPGPRYHLMTYYVRDGRRPGWNVAGREVKVIVEEID